MALLVKLRHSFGHRWMPFFLPVLGSLLYVLVVVLLIPEHLSPDAKAASDAEIDKTGSTSISGAKPADSAARAARRRSRVTPRATAQGVPGIAAPPAMPAAPAAPPMPASPDGND